VAAEAVVLAASAAEASVAAVLAEAGNGAFQVEKITSNEHDPSLLINH
jgi:hypothetical protein